MDDYRISHILGLGSIAFLILSWFIEPEKVMFCLSCTIVFAFAALASALQGD
jgi:hypothetical protein